MSDNYEIQRFQFARILRIFPCFFCCRWYIKDENAVPSTYLLKPVSKNIPDFLSEDFETQKAAKSQWWEESERLMEIIARGAASALDENAAKKYMISG